MVTNKVPQYVAFDRSADHYIVFAIFFVAKLCCCCCCWFTPPLPWDGGVAQTVSQVNVINLIELG